MKDNAKLSFSSFQQSASHAVSDQAGDSLQPVQWGDFLTPVQRLDLVAVILATIALREIREQKEAK